MKRAFRRVAWLTLLISLLAVPALPALAAPNPDFLLSDTDLTAADSMTIADIQTFLDQHGALGQFVGQDVDGARRTASEIIWRVAQSYQLSPRFLLALMQREQSLVESPHLTPYQLDWALGYARCDACDPTHPLVAAYKGFAKQLDGAAMRIRDYYLSSLEHQGKTQTGVGPGILAMIDGTRVTPYNNATAILYTYTPHLHGNLNFARIWKRWFSREIPDGTVLQTEDGKYWLIENGKRRKFETLAAFYSRYKPNQALSLPDTALDDYDDGLAIHYANYSVIRGPDGTAYLVDGDSIRPIASADVFRTIGYNPGEVDDVTDAELAAFSPGEPLTANSVYPTGALLQDKKTGGVYYVKDGVRHPIWAKEIMAARFPKKKITPVSPTALAAIPYGDPLGFADGTLVGVIGEPTVYVVSNGRRRAIRNEQTFHTLGWKFSDVIWTTTAVLQNHPIGEPFDIPAGADAIRTAGL